MKDDKKKRRPKGKARKDMPMPMLARPHFENVPVCRDDFSRKEGYIPYDYRYTDSDLFEQQYAE